MPAIEASSVASVESPGLVKMEDRKRAAAYEPNESAPPLKKQATGVNGGAKPHPDADMPWRDDLDVSARVLPSFSFGCFYVSSCSFCLVTGICWLTFLK